MPKYRILPGHTYRDADGSVKGPGAEIELGDDVAAMHPGSVELIPDAAEPAEQPAEPAPGQAGG